LGGKAGPGWKGDEVKGNHTRHAGIISHFVPEEHIKYKHKPVIIVNTKDKTVL